MEFDDAKLGVIIVFGLIKDVKLKFLLDTSAFHNFLSMHDAKSLGLSIYLGGVGSVKLVGFTRIGYEQFNTNPQTSMFDSQGTPTGRD